MVAPRPFPIATDSSALLDLRAVCQRPILNRRRSRGITAALQPFGGSTPQRFDLTRLVPEPNLSEAWLPSLI